MNGTAADPREIGELLNTWMAIKMDQVDAAVEQAHDKMAAIPDWQPLALLIGELTVRVQCLEYELARLKGAKP